MKKLFFVTTLASALAFALPTGAFAGQRMAVPRGGGAHFARPVAPGRPFLYSRAVPFYGYYGPAFGFGAAFDPLWYGWGYPAYYGPRYVVPVGVTGGLRIEVQPKTAQVFVDGYYAGLVDDFDGHFQHLNLTPGGHHIEVSQPGFQPLTFDTFIQADHTTDYKAALAPANAQ